MIRTFTLSAVMLGLIGCSGSDSTSSSSPQSDPRRQSEREEVVDIDSEPGPPTVSAITDISETGYVKQGLDAAALDKLPVPAPAGEGMKWVEQTELSDDFNYSFPETDDKTTFGDGKWYNFYHNSWDGPGSTYWQYDHVSVNGESGRLELRSSRSISTYKLNVPGVDAACITSHKRVVYPVFVEASVSLANIALASDVWLLSPDDTQEIDIIEAYGNAPGFREYIHLSHHSFIRNPFTDYQPRDKNSWFERAGVSNWGKYSWNDGDRKFVQVGVNWLGPKHFEYYIDGELVRVLYDKAFASKRLGKWEYTYPYRRGSKIAFDSKGYQAVKVHKKSREPFNFRLLQEASAKSKVSVIDPEDYQGGEGFTKEMDIIINIESQDWHVLAGRVPSDADLKDPTKNTMQVDWIRVYKPIQEGAISHQNEG